MGVPKLPAPQIMGVPKFFPNSSGGCPDLLCCNATSQGALPRTLFCDGCPRLQLALRVGETYCCMQAARAGHAPGRRVDLASHASGPVRHPATSPICFVPLVPKEICP
jgi:hypothetical protein